MPDKHQNKIDYILLKQSWLGTNIHGAKIVLGADKEDDHDLVMIPQVQSPLQHFSIDVGSETFHCFQVIKNNQFHFFIDAGSFDSCHKTLFPSNKKNNQINFFRLLWFMSQNLSLTGPVSYIINDFRGGQILIVWGLQGTAKLFLSWIFRISWSPRLLKTVRIESKEISISAKCMIWRWP